MLRPVRCVHDVYRVSDQELSRGGVGSIHATSDAGFVYKRYRDISKAPNRNDLQQLVDIGRDVLIKQGVRPGQMPRSSVNWPVDLHLEGDRVLGAVLPAIPRPLFNEYGVRTLDFLIFRRSQPPAGKQRIALLLRMAEILQYVDQLKLVHGDVNVKNLAWSATGLPGSDDPVMYLIDCDGMVKQLPPPTAGVSAANWRDPRLTEQRIPAHDHYSDWYALALAIYRGLMLVQGNLDKGTDGKWPKPSHIPADMPAALREPLRLALSNPLDTDARLNPSGWVAALRTAYIPGGVFDEAAVRRLDAVAFAATGRTPTPGRPPTLGRAKPRTGPSPRTGPGPRTPPPPPTGPAIKITVSTPPGRPWGPTPPGPPPPYPPSPGPPPPRPQTAPPVWGAPRPPLPANRRRRRRIVAALIALGILGGCGAYVYWLRLPVAADPAYVGHWEGSLRTTSGKTTEPVTIDVTGLERRRWEPVAWFTTSDPLQCHGELRLENSDPGRAALQAMHVVDDTEQQGSVCGDLESLEFELKSTGVSLKVMNSAGTPLATGTVKRTGQSPATLPKALVGAWQGTVKQDNSSWVAEVQLHEGAVGSAVGTSSYSTQSCQGELVLLTVKGKTAYLEESIKEQGPGLFNQCAERVLLKLSRTTSKTGTITYASVRKDWFSGTLKLRPPP